MSTPLPHIHTPADAALIAAAEVWAASRMQGLKSEPDAARQLVGHVARRQRALKTGEGSTACPACGRTP